MAKKDEVTEHKRVEETLEEELRFLWRIIDTAPNFIFVRDREGKFLLANEAMAQAYGSTVEDITGKTDADFNPNPEEVELFLHDDLEVMNSLQKKFLPERTITDAKGNVRWLEIVKFPLVDEDGVARRVLGIANDITDRVQAKKAVERRAAQLAMLNRIGRNVTHILDREELFQRAIDAVQEDLGYLRAAILLIDKEVDELYVAAATKDFWDIIPDGYRQPVDKGAIGMAAGSGEVVLVTDASTDPRPYKVGEWLARSSLSVPITIGGQVSGVLEVEDNLVGVFDENDVLALNTLADQVGVAIENARLYEQARQEITERVQMEQQIRESLERRSRQVQLTTEIAQEITGAPGLGEIYNYVVTSVKEGFGYYHVQIFRHDPEKDAMVVIEGSGEAGEKMLAAGHSLPFGTGVVGTAAATGEPVLASNVTDDPHWVPHPDLPDTKGELAVPIKWQDEVLGILDVQHNEPDALTEEDQVMLLGLAGQIASAVESARLFEETQQTLTNTQILYRLSRDLLGHDNVSDILQTVIDGMVKALEADRITIITFNLEAQQVIDFAQGGPGAGQVIHVSFDELWDGLSGWVLQERKPALSPKGKPDPRESPRVQKRREETNCGSIVVVPLMQRGKVLGTMTAINRLEEPDFTQRDADLMMTIGNQAAAALENIRLFEETQLSLSEAETLYRVAQNLGQMNEEQDMFEFILPEYLKYLGFSQGGILILNAENTQGTLKALIQKGQLVEVGLQIPVAGNLPLEEILETKEPVAITDACHSEQPVSVRNLAEELGYKSLLLVPLIIQDKVIGALGADATESVHEFTEREINLVQAIAYQLATAMANLRSLEDVQAALSEVEAVQRLYLREEWERFVPEQVTPLYERVREAPPSLGDNTIPQEEGEATRLAVPLTLRGETIGTLGLEKPEGEQTWSGEEMALVESVAEQLTVALESARLLDETRGRAARERLTGEITSRLRETLNVDSVMRTAVNEIYETIELEQVTIRLEAGSTHSQEERPA